MSSYSCMLSPMAAIEYLSKNQKIMEKERKITDEFLRYFCDLIEKLKPLYGIKEGGEE